MSNIERYDISEEWAHSGIIKAGDFCYLSYQDERKTPSFSYGDISGNSQYVKD